jgi:predicted MPP superfamily phosphohydrolase
VRALGLAGGALAAHSLAPFSRVGAGAALLATALALASPLGGARLGWRPLQRPWLELACAAWWLSTVFTLSGGVLVRVAEASGLVGASDRGLLMLGVLLSGSLLASWAVFFERRWLRVTRYEVSVAGLDARFDGYRIAHLSDLHLGPHVSPSLAERWLAVTRSLDADLIVLTGDLGVRAHYDVERVVAFVHALTAHDGVLISFGNHEKANADGLEAALKAADQPGVAVLRSTWKRIPRGDAELWAVGFDDHQRDPAHIRRVASERPAAPVLLLAHSPDLARVLDPLAASITFMGHTHGGQLALPGLGDQVNLATLSGQRGRGVHRVAGCTQILSAGLGTSGPPARLGMRPEIVLAVLRCGKGVVA